MSEVKYYLLNGIASANESKNIKAPARILEVPDNFPFMPKSLIGHNSISRLRKYDNNWKELKSRRGKIADRICEKRFILDCFDFVLTPLEKEFNEYSFTFLQHSIHGKYEKGFSGIHLLSAHNKDIIDIKQTKPEDKNKVWEADITVFNKERNKEYKKISTLFPKEWTPSHFMFEIYHAYKNRKVEEGKGYFYSETKSGIPVKIYIEGNKAKTIYPIYQTSGTK